MKAIEVLGANEVASFLSLKNYLIPCSFNIYSPDCACHHVITGGEIFTIKSPIDKADSILLNRLYLAVKKFTELMLRNKDIVIDDNVIVKDNIKKILFYCSDYKKIKDNKRRGFTKGLPLIYISIITKIDTFFGFNMGNLVNITPCCFLKTKST